MLGIKALGICGSSRVGGNTEVLLKLCLNELRRKGVEVEFLRLSDYSIKPCTGCRECLKRGECCIDDDMKRVIVPKLLSASIIVIASPVYFNNVSSYVKIFMDRTWSIRGRLKDKVGGAIVVGRGYGLAQALQQIHSFMLKHSMILCHRGVEARGFNKEEVLEDKEALRLTVELAGRLYEVALKVAR